MTLALSTMRVLSSCVLMLLVSSDAGAQVPTPAPEPIGSRAGRLFDQMEGSVEPEHSRESKAVWSMLQGDTFTVSVATTKRTTVSRGTAEPETTETRDNLRIEYQAVEVREDGEAFVVASINDPAREVLNGDSTFIQSQKAVAALDNVAVLFQVDPDGNIQRISAADRAEIIALLAGNHARLAMLLDRSLPNEVMASWISRPFWLAVHREDAVPLATWNRTDSFSVGAFGTVNSDVQMKLASLIDDAGSVVVSAESRFVPLVMPQTEKSRPPAILEDVEMDVDSWEGAGNFKLGPQPRTDDEARNEQQPKDAERTEESPTSRPQFESLKFTVRCHGEGKMPTADGRAATEVVKFQQTVTESWMLEGYSFGRRELLFGPFAPVIPRN